MRKALTVVFLLLTAIGLFASTTLRIKADTIKGSSDLISLAGNVYIEKEGEMTVETEEAELSAVGNNWERFIATGETLAIFSNGTSRSLYLDYNMNSSSGVMRNEVYAEFVETDREGKIIINDADVLEFDLDSESYVGSSLPEDDPEFKPLFILYRDEMEITALQFEYYSGDSLMILTGRVLVIDHKNNRTIRASELIYNTDDDSFEGKAVEMEIILEDD